MEPQPKASTMSFSPKTQSHVSNGLLNLLTESSTGISAVQAEVRCLPLTHPPFPSFYITYLRLRHCGAPNLSNQKKTLVASSFPAFRTLSHPIWFYPDINSNAFYSQTRRKSSLPDFVLYTDASPSAEHSAENIIGHHLIFIVRINEQKIKIPLWLSIVHKVKTLQQNIRGPSVYVPKLFF